MYIAVLKTMPMFSPSDLLLSGLPHRYLAVVTFSSAFAVTTSRRSQSSPSQRVSCRKHVRYPLFFSPRGHVQ
jgi:hypothetical protein